jgi:ABC-type multidrug transport system ATPase subunit
MVGLEDVARRPAGRFSLGMSQRLALTHAEVEYSAATTQPRRADA